jgi:hypothetical protein
MDQVILKNMNQQDIVLVSLSGGLGNQMFQFASSYAIAKKNNALLVLDIAQFDSSDRDHAKYVLSKFGIKNDAVKITSGLSWRLVRKLGVIFKIPYIFSLRLNGFFKIVVEDSMLFQDNITAFSNCNIFITNSQLQSPKYFHHIKDEINSIFRFSNELKTRKLKRKSKVLSIHIRRGDYENPDCSMCLLDKSYYINSYKYIISHFESVNWVYIFTDDVEWVKKNMQDLFDICENIFIIEEVFVNISAFESMSIMANCNLSIISNSTFSWWGAYLGKEKEVVIAPSKWFIDNRTHNIIPENWITLPG